MKKNCGTMKFFTSLLLLATAVADAREIEGGSGTRAREDRMLQLFGGFLGGFGMDLSLECDARCSDEAVCESFLMDMSSGALERQCDAACIPELALTSCDLLCGDDAAALPSSSLLRQGLGGGSLLCQNCAFFGCCLDGQGSQTCGDLLNLPDAVEIDSILSDTNMLQSGNESELLDGGIFTGGLTEGPCASVFSGAPDESIMEKICDNNCLPAAMSCEGVCNEDSFFGSFDLACDTCEFMSCCQQDQATDTKFETCQQYLPDLTLPEPNLGLDWVNSSIDWSNFTSEIDFIFDGLIWDLTDRDDTCFISDSCPVQGLCDYSANWTALDNDSLCSENALLLCLPPDFGKMCASECGDGTSSSPGGVLAVPFCSLCSIAQCCSGKDSTAESPFEECALGSVSTEVSELLLAFSESDIVGLMHDLVDTVIGNHTIHFDTDSILSGYPSAEMVEEVGPHEASKIEEPSSTTDSIDANQVPEATDLDTQPTEANEVREAQLNIEAVKAPLEADEAASSGLTVAASGLCLATLTSASMILAL